MAHASRATKSGEYFRSVFLTVSHKKAQKGTKEDVDLFRAFALLSLFVVLVLLRVLALRRPDL